ncbi:uncharacterized protein LOC117296548 [Asterias rubens]|uniref:uncharacterized protein LOC117296548 n=1 Tax=Asterias rubens TaxID=7604 RepID=UPI0014558FC5|nr:uncharacterized protein LOC117296548 [Asterias rubens]
MPHHAQCTPIHFSVPEYAYIEFYTSYNYGYMLALCTMDSCDEPDFLELMAGPSGAIDTQEDPGLGQGENSSIGGTLSKLKVKGRKPKCSLVPSSDTVSRQEFADVSGKLACMAEAIENMQTVILSRPAKRPRLSSDSESDTESASKAIDELPQESQQGPKTSCHDDQLLDNFEQLYAEDAPTADAVNDKLAKIVDKMVRHKLPEDKAVEKLKAIQRPTNVKNLECKRVNPEIWSSLKPKTRSQDIKFQKVQQALLKGIIPVVGVINSLMSSPAATQGIPDFKSEITKLLDAVAIIGHANQELNVRRRDLIKPFSGLCSPHVPVTGFLFGDDLPQQCKDIQQTNKIGNKVGWSTFRGNDKHD